MPPIVKRLLGQLVITIAVAIVFHKHLDIVGPILGFVLLVLIGVYGLAPDMIDRMGQIRHDKAPIPELWRARKARLNGDSTKDPMSSAGDQR